jgi:aryl sulfotransferase
LKPHTAVPDLPEQKRSYQNHILNGDAWNRFSPRDDDIVIATSLKTGTTWMQAIVENLIFQGRTLPATVWELSPWLERRLGNTDETLARLEGQMHRRCIKTHLPLDALPYHSQVKYIYVGRDGRDVFMSLWNHHRHLTDETLRAYHEFLVPQNQLLPACPEDIHDFFAQWISQSWFPWEAEGFPYWSPLYHLRSWWRYRHLSNILFVHFNDLLDDLDGEMRRIAAYLDIEVKATAWSRLLERMKFQQMQDSAEQYAPGSGKFLRGGAKRFFNVGSNGHWRGILNDDELEQYTAAVQRQLLGDCQRWLEYGKAPGI